MFHSVNQNNQDECQFLFGHESKDIQKYPRYTSFWQENWLFNPCPWIFGTFRPILWAVVRSFWVKMAGHIKSFRCSAFLRSGLESGSISTVKFSSSHTVWLEFRIKLVSGLRIWRSKIDGQVLGRLLDYVLYCNSNGCWISMKSFSLLVVQHHNHCLLLVVRIIYSELVRRS